MLKSNSDYWVPLLRVMAGLPDGTGTKEEAVRSFGARFRAEIAPEGFGLRRDGSTIVWEHKVAWARYELVQLGLLDAPGRGIWRITDLGRQWLAANPHATHLTQQNPPATPPVAPVADSDITPKAVDGSRGESEQVVRMTLAGRKVELTQAALLAAVRQAIQAGLPPESADFQKWFVEIDNFRMNVKWALEQATHIRRDAFQSHQARDILLRLGFQVHRVDARGTAGSDPKCSIPHSRQAEAGDEGGRTRRYGILEREVESIRAFLNGRAERPSDERLCDWVHFCYTFELFDEGARLLPVIEPTNINPWHFERTRRLARTCALRQVQVPDAE